MEGFWDRLHKEMAEFNANMEIAEYAEQIARLEAEKQVAKT